MDIITNFEQLYRYNALIRKPFKKFSKEDFANNEAYRKFLREKARAYVASAQLNIMLYKLFAEQMPYTFVDALNIEGFDLKKYFELLKKYPCLVRANKEAVKSLLISLNTQDPARFGMEEFPLPAEFGI
ncbi:MAG: hypothetical protein IJS26_06545 [Alphaproteobacteria bacterium]|nr:hypothetical protein [Alphaproteobacteria bacterium]